MNSTTFPLFRRAKSEPTKADRVFSISLEYFNNHKNKEIDIDFYLATKGTCQQTEGTLQ